MKKYNLSKILELSSKLKNNGFNKYADELEYKFLMLKQSESKLYSVFKETGDSLLSDAHPSGSVNLFDGNKDLNEIEDLLSQKEKILKVIKKEPTGKLSFAANIIKNAGGISAKSIENALAVLTRGAEESVPLARRIESSTNRIYNDIRSIFRKKGLSLHVNGDTNLETIDELLNKEAGGYLGNQVSEIARLSHGNLNNPEAAYELQSAGRSLLYDLERRTGYGPNTEEYKALAKMIEEITSGAIYAAERSKLQGIAAGTADAFNKIKSGKPKTALQGIENLKKFFNDEILKSQNSGNWTYAESLRKLMEGSLTDMAEEATRIASTNVRGTSEKMFASTKYLRIPSWNNLRKIGSELVPYPEAFAKYEKALEDLKVAAPDAYRDYWVLGGTALTPVAIILAIRNRKDLLNDISDIAKDVLNIGEDKKDESKKDDKKTSPELTSEIQKLIKRTAEVYEAKRSAYDAKGKTDDDAFKESVVKGVNYSAKNWGEWCKKHQNDKEFAPTLTVEELTNRLMIINNIPNPK